MTPDDVENAWETIGKQGAQGSPYLYLQLSSGGLPIGAIMRSEDRRPGLMVRFSPEDVSLIPSPSIGRGIILERAVPFGDGTTGVPLLLADLSLRDIFSQLCADLVNAALAPAVSVSPAARVLRRLDTWRRFLQKNSAPLSREQVQGLFAELSVLRQASMIYGPEAALDSWWGWNRELHDFRFGSDLIEVKSWRLGSSAGVRISTPNQVIVDPHNPMTLAAVQVSDSGHFGRTLPELVDRIAATLSEPSQLVFVDHLAMVGFHAAHAFLYDVRLVATRTDLFSVREGFPHIPPASVPGGVADLSYSISLGALESFRTTSPHLGTPDD